MRRFFLASAAALLLYSLALADKQAQVVVPQKVEPMSLAQLRQLALAKQPAITAAHLSYRAACARSEALSSLKVPNFLQSDLPIRRKQAELGVQAAKAEILQAEINTLYGVDFGYLSFLYARTQLQLAEQTIKEIEEIREVVAGVVKEIKENPKFRDRNRTDLTQEDADRLEGIILLTQSKRTEAELGGHRALSALREALCLPPGSPLTVQGELMPVVDVKVDFDAMLALAMARRPELLRAALAVQVTELEAQAQQERKTALQLNTFAAGSDIHATGIPEGRYDEEYRPGAVAPEMPSLLAGCQSDRVTIAKIYEDRAVSVNHKARNLIALEVEQAYLRWREATQKLELVLKGEIAAAKALNGLREKFTFEPKPKVTLETIINAAIVLTQLRVAVNEARHQQLIALAGLERATAGGAQFGLEKLPLTPVDPKKEKSE